MIVKNTCCVFAAVSALSLAPVFFTPPVLCSSVQKANAKDAKAILDLAERFLAACSKEDVKALKAMTSFPLNVYAPCKGGPVDSVEEFRDGHLRRGKGIKAPKAYQTRVVISTEKYLRSIAWAFASEKELQSHLKDLGKDVHVACLVHGKKEDDFAMAVLVRRNRDGLRVIGLGVLGREVVSP